MSDPTPENNGSPVYQWLSFYVPDQHFREFELHSPWWVSGYGDDTTIVVAAIRAENENDAWQVVDDSFDNEPHYDKRFIETVRVDVSPFTDRFPRAEWMRWATP